MVDQYFCAAPNATISSSDSRLGDATSSLANQMDDYSSTYSYSHYHPDSYELQLDMSKYGTSDSDEKEYLKDASKQLAQDHREAEITIANGDVWIIVDEEWKWGYGRMGGKYYVDLDGDGTVSDEIWVGRSIKTDGITYDDPKVTEQFVIHESGHAFSASHNDGEYAVNSSDEMFDVSPMLTSYLEDDLGDPDTDYSGGSLNDPPVCNGLGNNEYPGYCGDVSDWCRHQYRLSPCTKDAIESSTPLS